MPPIVPRPSSSARSSHEFSFQEHVTDNSKAFAASLGTAAQIPLKGKASALEKPMGDVNVQNSPASRGTLTLNRDSLDSADADFAQPLPSGYASPEAENGTTASRFFGRASTFSGILKQGAQKLQSAISPPSSSRAAPKPFYTLESERRLASSAQSSNGSVHSLGARLEDDFEEGDFHEWTEMNAQDGEARLGLKSENNAVKIVRLPDNDAGGAGKTINTYPLLQQQKATHRLEDEYDFIALPDEDKYTVLMDSNLDYAVDQIIETRVFEAMNPSPLKPRLTKLKEMAAQKADKLATITYNAYFAMHDPKAYAESKLDTKKLDDSIGRFFRKGSKGGVVDVNALLGNIVNDYRALIRPLTDKQPAAVAAEMNGWLEYLEGYVSHRDLNDTQMVTVHLEKVRNALYNISYLAKFPSTIKKINYDADAQRDVQNILSFVPPQNRALVQGVVDRLLEASHPALEPKDLEQPLFAFMGPPGVGKTSTLVKILKRLNYPFATVRLPEKIRHMDDLINPKGLRAIISKDPLIFKKQDFSQLLGYWLDGAIQTGYRNGLVLFDEGDALTRLNENRSSVDAKALLYLKSRIGSMDERDFDVNISGSYSSNMSIPLFKQGVLITSNHNIEDITLRSRFTVVQFDELDKAGLTNAVKIALKTISERWEKMYAQDDPAFYALLRDKGLPYLEGKAEALADLTAARTITVDLSKKVQEVASINHDGRDIRQLVLSLAGEVKKTLQVYKKLPDDGKFSDRMALMVDKSFKGKHEFTEKRVKDEYQQRIRALSRAAPPPPPPGYALRPMPMPMAHANPQPQQVAAHGDDDFSSGEFDSE